MSPLARFREKMEAEGLDAFLIMQGDNRRYLTGFSGSNGILLITPTEQYLLTDSRYYERVKQEAPDWTLVEAGSKTIDGLKELVPQSGLKGAKIGFEADYVTVSQLNRLKAMLPDIELIGLDGFVITLRAVKTAAELAAIRKAIALTDQAMAHIYTWIQPSMTEKEVAWELEAFMRTRGASKLAFETIVAAAAHGASPHASVSDYQIQLGDVVVIDVGCVIDGYCADLTRTFSIGEPLDADYLKVWELVHQANRVAIAGIKAGISGIEADALARNIIKAAGYGDNFGHSLGHGIGLAIHEYPRASYLTEDPLEAGSVVTIEPGVYLPKRFGVRLEDVVVVHPDGVEVLTGVPKIPVLER